MILLILVVTALYVLLQIADRMKENTDNVVYVTSPSYSPLWWGGQGPLWRGPLPGGRPWRRGHRRARRH